MKVNMKSSSFKIKGRPRLINFNIKVCDNFNSEEEVKIQIGHDITVDLNEDMKATVTLVLGIFNNEENENVPFRILMANSAEFVWNEELDSDKELLDIMLNQNAPAVLVGYLRPIVTLMTSEGGIEPFVLPLIDFTK